MIPKEQIEKALKDAYEKAGHNAYFGNGFKAGVEFAIQQLKNCNAPAVSVNEVAVCPKCHDRGWLYSDDGSNRTVCPCHY